MNRCCTQCTNVHQMGLFMSKLLLDQATSTSTIHLKMACSDGKYKLAKLRVKMLNLFSTSCTLMDFYVCIRGALIFDLANEMK